MLIEKEEGMDVNGDVEMVAREEEKTDKIIENTSDCKPETESEQEKSMFKVKLTMSEDRDLRDKEEVAVVLMQPEREEREKEREREGFGGKNVESLLGADSLDFENVPEGTPVWVKWRGRWQAALKSSPEHCREAVLKARPTYASKTYLLVFFPRSATFAWADSQSLLPISENPQPLASGSHELGRSITRNLSVPRRIAILRVGADVLDISDRLHVKAVVEAAQSASMWRSFAQRTAHAETYQELGQLLVDTFEVIVKDYVNVKWLKQRCADWKSSCLAADRASSIEQLNEELINSVLWDKVQPLWDDPDQPNLGADWATWKEPWTRAYAKWKSLSSSSEKGEVSKNSSGGNRRKRGASIMRGRIQDFARSRQQNGQSLTSGVATLLNLSSPQHDSEQARADLKLPPGLWESSSQSHQTLLPLQNVSEAQLNLQIEGSRKIADLPSAGPPSPDILPQDAAIAADLRGGEGAAPTPHALSAIAHAHHAPSEINLEEEIVHDRTRACQGAKAHGGQCTHLAKPGSHFCAKHAWQANPAGYGTGVKLEREEDTTLKLVSSPNDGPKQDQTPPPKKWLPPEERCMGIRTPRLGGGPCPHPRRPGQPFCGRHARYAYRGLKKNEEGDDSEEEAEEWNMERKGSGALEAQGPFLGSTEQMSSIMSSWQKSRRSAQRRKIAELSELHTKWEEKEKSGEAEQATDVGTLIKKQTKSVGSGEAGLDIPDDERCISELTSWKKEGRCPHKRRPGELFCGFHKRWRAVEDGAVVTPAKKQKIAATEARAIEWKHVNETTVGEGEGERGGDEGIGGWEKGPEEGDEEICIAIRSTRGGGRCTQSRRLGSVYCGKHLKKFSGVSEGGQEALAKGHRRGRPSLWLWKDLTESLADEMKASNVGDGEAKIDEKNLIDAAQEVVSRLKRSVLKRGKRAAEQPGIGGSDLVALSVALDKTEEGLSGNLPLAKVVLQMVEMELNKMQPVLDYLELRSEIRRKKRTMYFGRDANVPTAAGYVGSTPSSVTVKTGESVLKLRELRQAAMLSMGVQIAEKEGGSEVAGQGFGGSYRGPRGPRKSAKVEVPKGSSLDEEAEEVGSKGEVGARRPRVRCVNCQKRFKRQAFLTRHIELKKCKGPEGMNEGDEEDQTIQGSRTAVVRDEGEKIWPCSVCGEKFFLMPDLGRHWKAQHREILMERQAKKVAGRWRKRDSGGGLLGAKENGSVEKNKQNSIGVNGVSSKNSIGTPFLPSFHESENGIVMSTEGSSDKQPLEGSDGGDFRMRNPLVSPITSTSRFRDMAFLYNYGQEGEASTAGKQENSSGVESLSQRMMGGRKEIDGVFLSGGNTVTGAAHISMLEMSRGLQVDGGLSPADDQNTATGPSDDEILEAARSSCCVWRVLHVLQEKYNDLSTRVELQALKLKSTLGLLLKPGKCIKCSAGAGKPPSVKSESGGQTPRKESFGRRAARKGGSRSKSRGGGAVSAEKDSSAMQLSNEAYISSEFQMTETHPKRQKLEVIRGSLGRTQQEEAWPLNRTGWPPEVVGEGAMTAGFHMGLPSAFTGGMYFPPKFVEGKFWEGGTPQLPEGYLSRRAVGKVVLSDDLSGGAEPVPIPCVVDNDVVEPCSCDLCRDSGGRLDISDNLKPADGFTYVTKRRLDPGLGLDPKNSQLGCQCVGNQCSPATCEHVAFFREDNMDACDIHGQPMLGRFPYDAKGRIILQENYMVYECNSECKCGDACGNRVLQRGVKVHLEVFRTHHKGWAVRAAQAIPRGAFICEYVGEVIDDKEATKRGLKYDQVGLSYLYDIDAHIDASALRRGVRPFVIDATTVGNVARFINHSCAPNLVNYQVLVESMDYQLAHIGLYAARDIWPGEELAYDYRYRLLPGKGCPCHCGAPTCRGRLY